MRTVCRLRVRYSETDQMGTIDNARALEWFERARTELLRGLGLAYAQVERRGIMLPVIEAHVAYLARARYDDPLDISAAARRCGRARVRFDVNIAHADGARDVVRGYTIHAVTDPSGRVVRPPEWLTSVLEATDDAEDSGGAQQ
ncbi:MAG: acyl-CoA thioesterase [Planctomycetota bacterium]